MVHFAVLIIFSETNLGNENWKSSKTQSLSYVGNDDLGLDFTKCLAKKQYIHVPMMELNPDIPHEKPQALLGRACGTKRLVTHLQYFSLGCLCLCNRFSLRWKVFKLEGSLINKVCNKQDKPTITIYRGRNGWFLWSQSSLSQKLSVVNQ